MHLKIKGILVICLFVLMGGCRENLDSWADTVPENTNAGFLDQGKLEKDLAWSRGTIVEKGTWPRTIKYQYITHNWETASSRTEEKSVTLTAKPRRIIAHSVGVSEILWALVPREHLLGFHQLCTEPEHSVLWTEFRKTQRIFSARETEKIVAWEPDLVFTVAYSSPEFKKTLQLAGIQIVDLGYVNDIEGIKRQISFLGQCLGEEENSRNLNACIDKYLQLIQRRVALKRTKIKTIFYTSFGSVAGKDGTFDNLCRLTGLVNLGAEAGLKGFKKIEAEWLLQQNPDIIVVSNPAVLKKMRVDPVLGEVKAVKQGKVIYIPAAYTSAISQYMVAAANMLAQKAYAVMD